jgi:predicted MFS family arabinose efflux permease
MAVGLPTLVAQGAGFRDAFLVLAVAGLLAVVASAVRGHGRAQASPPPVCSQEVSIATPSDHITADRSEER